MERPFSWKAMGNINWDKLLFNLLASPERGGGKTEGFDGRVLNLVPFKNGRIISAPTVLWEQ